MKMPPLINIPFFLIFLLIIVSFWEPSIIPIVNGDTRDCNCKPNIVTYLENKWGTGAKIYWNDEGVAVIANDGYVSEFDLNGRTIHYGMIE